MSVQGVDDLIKRLDKVHKILMMPSINFKDKHMVGGIVFHKHI